jgi:transcription termination factor Rho
MSLQERKKQFRFDQLTTIQPKQKLNLETKDGRMTTRVLDLFCPIGKGQRSLIVAPPRAGKTTILHDIAKGVEENHPECHLMVLLIDERPEEVTDFSRSVPAEIYASSNDEEVKSHLRIAELAIERAKRLVESKKDVVLLLDSITRLSRAYNAASGKSGRTMTGGLDVRALEKPRQIFSSARNSEEAGSLTIVATALVETGSKMDELIFQEFKGTGNCEIILDRKVAELRLWPALNLASSGTRKEEDLVDPQILEKTSFLRRAMSPMKIIDATESLLDRMTTTQSNEEFLKLIQTP